MRHEKTVVQLRDLQLNLQIGFNEHEYGRRQQVHFWIDVELNEDWELEPQGRYCYGALHGRLKKLEEQPHVVFVETIAETVAKVCFEDPRAYRVTVKVEKQRVLDNLESGGVQRTFVRD